MAAWVDGEARDLLTDLAGQRVEELQSLDFVVKQFDAQSQLRMLGRKDIDGVATHAEGAAAEFHFIPGVLHADQLGDDIALPHLVAVAQRHHHLVVIARVADAVDGRNRGHDDHIAPFHQALGGGEAQLLDVFVDGAVLLDEQIALRHIGLGLVVVVVADEILDRIVGKEIAEFAVELGRQRLVGGKDDGRTPQAGDHIGHGEGLAGAGHAQQSLVAQAIVDAFDQLGNRRRLVSCRRKRLKQLKRRAFERHELTLGRLSTFGSFVNEAI